MPDAGAFFCLFFVRSFARNLVRKSIGLHVVCDVYIVYFLVYILYVFYVIVSGSRGTSRSVPLLVEWPLMTPMSKMTLVVVLPFGGD